jgi:glycosyltransferase involved in cell wall biosynthesis
METAQDKRKRKRIMFLFRYGIRDHAELHTIIPEAVRRLGEEHNVLYAGPNRHRIPPEYRFPGVRYLHVPFKVDRSSFRDKLLKTILWYVYLPFLALYARIWRADLIWVDESIPLVGILVEILSGRRVALTVVDFFLEVYSERYPFIKPIAKLELAFERLAWKRCAGIITRAASMKNYLLQQGVDAAKIWVIRDAFDLAAFRPGRNEELRRRYQFGRDDVVLCHHGILHPNKGIGRILAWLAPLMRDDPRLKFLVIGDGPEMPALRNAVERERLTGRVVFTGWLRTSEEVGAHLNASDIGLVMRIGQFSDHFHVTGTLVHCLMCGLPVLAARLEGIQEVVTDGEEGFLFDPGSAAEFARGLSRLASDPDLRTRMGEKAYARAVEKFNRQRVADDTVRALNTFLGCGAPSS